MEILKHGLLSFISSVGFALIFLVPKNRLIYSGISGMFGWLVFWLSNRFLTGEIIATFLGAFTIAWISNIFARKLKTPATLFNIPGIVPLVPGVASYQMTFALIEGHYSQAAHYGIRVAFIAGAIAGGLITFDLVLRLIKK